MLYNPLWEYKQGKYLSQLEKSICTALYCTNYTTLMIASAATLVTVLATWRHL